MLTGNMSHRSERFGPLGLRTRTVLIVAAALMFAGFSATQALKASRAGNRAESRSEAVAARSAVNKSSLGEPILTGLDAAATHRSAVRPATELVAIEQLQVGERVLAESPTGEEDQQFGSDIIPSEWRKLTLRAPKRDGTVADVVLLRPLTWLNQQRGEVGGKVFISVPECGIDGNAEILEIDPCPEILPGEGRVITGTFRHQVSASISLSIAGQAEPILCTGNHPFWSEDRQDFVRADSLQPNETLRTATGTTTVTSFCHIPGSTPVYNLEIHGTHVYHVGTSGVLVHNGDPELPIIGGNCWWAAQLAAEAIAKEKMFASANQAYANGLYSNAGRALTKHPNIVGLASAADLVKRYKNQFGINKAAADALKDIMANGVQSAKSTKAFGPVIDFKLPSGLGARFNALTNEFIGFLGR